jgi:DNA polymerase-3 subunit beta
VALPTTEDSLRGGEATEQLNIEGKRSGDGFIAHKATLVSALYRALADRVTIIGLTVGRKGLLAYLKALKGSNLVKVVPSNGVDSVPHDTAKRLKVICGGNIGYLAENEFIKEPSTKGKTAKGGTPYTFCELRVSPKVTVKPNMGVSEFAEALNRVLPFTANDEKRPVLGCVKVEAKEGKVRLVSADGFTLAVLDLDCESEGEALISALDLKGVANALRKAKRLAVSIEGETDSKEGKSLIAQTELIRYRWLDMPGTFPNYKQLIPENFRASAHFDTQEALQAVASLKALANAKDFAIDMTIGNGKVTLANPDNKGFTEVNADTEGEGQIRISGSYLYRVLKASGGAVDFRLSNAYSPMLFSTNGYKVVVMPMFSTYSQQEQAKDAAEAKAKAEGEGAQPQATDVIAEAEAVASQAQASQPAEGESKPKSKRKPKSKGKPKAQADEPLDDEVVELPPEKAKEPVAVTS